MAARDSLPLRPWGATRMTPCSGGGVPSYAFVELNPDTQVARYFDARPASGTGSKKKPDCR